MSIAKLIELHRSGWEPPPMTPEQIKEMRERLAQFDRECEERHRQRIPTQEQLNRVIDYGIRNP